GARPGAARPPQGPHQARGRRPPAPRRHRRTCKSYPTPVVKAKDMPGDRLANAISANVTLGVQTLGSLEPIVGPAVSRGQVKIVGAVYDLRTGAVALTG